MVTVRQMYHLYYCIFNLCSTVQQILSSLLLILRDSDPHINNTLVTNLKFIFIETDWLTSTVHPVMPYFRSLSRLIRIQWVPVREKRRSIEREGGEIGKRMTSPTFSSPVSFDPFVASWLVPRESCFHKWPGESFFERVTFNFELTFASERTGRG